MLVLLTQSHFTSFVLLNILTSVEVSTQYLYHLCHPKCHCHVLKHIHQARAINLWTRDTKEPRQDKTGIFYYFCYDLFYPCLSISCPCPSLFCPSVKAGTSLVRHDFAFNLFLFSQHFSQHLLQRTCNLPSIRE